MENTTRPTITTGHGEKNPHGRELVLDPSHPAESLRAQLDELTGEAWWAPHSWRDDHRRNANWERASFLALDLDYHDGSRELDAEGRVRKDHVAVPGQLRARVESMLQTLSLPDALEMEDGQLRLGEGLVVAHPTPRGHRVVLTLRAPITDAALYGRALAGAARLMTDELKASGLLGVPNEEPGLCVDASARDLARMLWAPRAHPPKEKVPRDARCTVYGAPGARPFDALALAKCAPHDTHSARAVVEEPPHARWPDIRAALSEGKAPADADRVPVRCLFHADRTASAVVFASGRLHCSSCARSWPLDVWAREKGAEKLLGGELTRALVGGTDDARPSRLEELWRTVADRQSDARWFHEEPPARRWLLTVAPDDEEQNERHILPMGKVGMLAAGGGVGKTMALVQLALAVSTGRPWLATASGSGGFQTPAGGGRVLLALGEEDELEVRRRLFRAAELMRRAGDRHVEADLRKAAERIVVLPLAGRDVSLVDGPNARIGKLSSSSSQTAGDLARLLEEDGQRRGDWALVVVDPLSRFAGIDSEKDNAAATRFIQELERFTEAPGTPTVLVAHHASQDGRTKSKNGEQADDTHARGVTALSDGVRWHAALAKRDADDVRLATLAVVKSNYGPFLRRPMLLARGTYGELTEATKAEVARYESARKQPAAPPKTEKTKTSKTDDDYGYMDQ